MQSPWTRASGLVVLVVALTTALMLAPPRVYGARRDTRSIRGGVQRLDHADPGHEGGELTESTAVRSPAGSMPHLWLAGVGPQPEHAPSDECAGALAPQALVGLFLDARRWALPDADCPVSSLRRPAAAGRAPPLA